MSSAKKQASASENWYRHVPSYLRTKVEFVDLTKPAHLVQGPKPAIGVSRTLQPDLVVNHVLTEHVDCVVQEGNPFFSTEVGAAAIICGSPKDFFKFPVSTTLSPNELNKKSEQKMMRLFASFKEPSEKTKLLNDLNHEARTLSRSESFVSEAAMVADELITNAIFNAPFVSDENRSGADRSLRTLISKDQKNSEFFVATDGDRLILGCRDPFGGLDINYLLNKVYRCYVQGVDKNINMGHGGAGIGSFMVFNTGASYYLAVEKGKQTIVCASLPLKMSGSKRSLLPKNLLSVTIKEDI